MSNLNKAPSPSTFALIDSLIFTGEAFVEGHALLVQDDKIIDLCPQHKIPDTFVPQSHPHHILSAGFIDCQVNGGGNVLFNNKPTPEGALQIAAAHRQTGTTSLLPTCITDTPATLEAAINATREARVQDSSILGIHLEGPHISTERSGAHNPTFMHPLSEADFALYWRRGDEVFMITLAPEVVSPQDIRKLTAQGITVCAGHTMAQRDTLMPALEAGMKGFTHLYTRMAPITSREPGAAGIAMDDSQTWVGMICDNVHLAPELVRIAVRAKAADKLYMVSDAAAPAGAATPEPFTWNGIKVFPNEGRLINENGSIAGAMLTLGECVPVAIRDIRLDPERVLRMASTIPAEFLGYGERLGKLLPNYQADIVAMNHSFKTEFVWKNGVKHR